MRKKTTTLPEAKVCRFELNPESGWYAKTGGPEGFHKVPDELRIEDAMRADINASKVIRSRQRGGRYHFFTGLLRTKFPGVFFGDTYEFMPGGKKVNSFCLFVFGDNRGLTVHFFNAYKVYPGRRAAFIENYLRALKTV